jgi:tRNA threonylcarbamoyladenosine biosynthesis protein TsaB
MAAMIARLHSGDGSGTPDAATSMAGCSAPALAMSVPLLAFDTSTEALAAAVQADTGLFCWNGAGGSAASAQLIPRIRGLMTRAGLDFAQLRAIAFGSGPGAFTGLRTACAVAQGLAFGAALPVVALDSLLIVAEDARVRLPSAGAGAAAAPIDVAIDVVMDARMGEVYGASYRWAGGRWQVLSAPALYTLDALNAAWTAAPPRCVAGSALQAFGARLRCGDAIRINDEADRAAATMRLAQQRWRDAGGVDAAAALPIYLRDKVALTVTERLALRDAEAAR